TNAGTVRPGSDAAPGALTINGDYSQTATGTLSLRLGGLTAAADYDQLVVDGFATLDGTLDLHLVNGFVPQPGDLLQPLLFARGRAPSAHSGGAAGGLSFLSVYEAGDSLPPGLILVANCPPPPFRSRGRALCAGRGRRRGPAPAPYPSTGPAMWTR